MKTLRAAYSDLPDSLRGVTDLETLVNHKSGVEFVRTALRSAVQFVHSTVPSKTVFIAADNEVVEDIGGKHGFRVRWLVTPLNVVFMAYQITSRTEAGQALFTGRGGVQQLEYRGTRLCAHGNFELGGRHIAHVLDLSPVASSEAIAAFLAMPLYVYSRSAELLQQAKHSA